MPFTPTHVAAILPLWPLRRWLPFVALAIGAMVPDITMFFPFLPYSHTHSSSGVFTTCLPVGISIVLLFEIMMRRPLVALLPLWFQRRIESSPQIPTSPRLAAHLYFYVGLAVAVVLGAFTHQVWDAFTHQGRWGTNVIPSLNASFQIGNYDVPGYKLFQYGSTFLGLPLMAILALLYLWNVRPREDIDDCMSPRLKLAAALILCVIPLIVGTHAARTEATLDRALGVTIKSSGAIILTLAIVYCAVFQIVSDTNATQNN